MLRIKEIRKSKKITQDELSKKSGIPRRTLIAYEANEHDPPISKVQYIALALGVSISELVSQGEENTTPASKVGIPIVSTLAAASFGNESFSIEEQDIKEYCVVPKFKNLNADFMIEVVGDSMKPTCNSGDLIACSIIKNYKFIQWHRIYLIATKDQGLLLKRLSRGTTEDTVIAISDNPEYLPFEIPLSEITGVAIALGTINVC